MRRILITVFVSLFVECGSSALNAQIVSTQSSFSDTIELGSLPSVKGSAEDLLKKNMIFEEQVQSLTEALVQNKIDADAAVAENRELKARIEALGLNAIGNDRVKLEQRLIKAVSDLSVSQSTLEENRKVLTSLTEAVISLLKKAKDVPPEERVAVEECLRIANGNLEGGSDENPESTLADAGLTDARVISLKPEIGLIIGNIGAGNSVKVGMPFRIYEGQDAVAVARVVDVRDKVFGALIQETLSEKIPVKVGQRLRVVAN